MTSKLIKMLCDRPMEEMIEHIKESEGYERFVYKCPAGVLTVGYGRNLESNGISEEEAEFLLMNDIKKVIADLDLFLPWWSLMSEKRQMVLIDMGFNLGITRLNKFTKTLTEMQQGNYIKAADMMLQSKWASQVGDRAKKLAQWMRNG